MPADRLCKGRDSLVLQFDRRLSHAPEWRSSRNGLNQHAGTAFRSRGEADLADTTSEPQLLAETLVPGSTYVSFNRTCRAPISS